MANCGTASVIAIGSKPGIGATKKLQGEGKDGKLFSGIKK